MDFGEFQDRATPVLLPPDSRLYAAVGLGGEVGEVLNVCKKIERDGGSGQLYDALVEEAGDVLFYLRMLLDEHGYSLEHAAEVCLEKLDRKREELEQRNA